MYIKRKLKSFISQRWNIGFTEMPIEDIISGKNIKYRWLKHDYKNRWFADPFILDVTPDCYIILAEDYDEKRGYANISRLVIDKRTMELLDIITVLSVGSHLSFPYIIRENDDIFLLPENSQSGKLNLYKYNIEQNKFLFCETIICEALTDAVPLKHDGEDYIFSTKLPNPNGRELLIYKKNKGVYVLTETVLFQNRYARMGGAFLEINGNLYRPAQDNDNCYGGALCIQKVSCIKDSWYFENISHLTSPNPDYKIGFHTLNQYKGVIAVDVNGYSHHPWISSVITKIVNSFRTLN